MSKKSEVPEQPESLLGGTVLVPKEELKKVANVFASGARLLRQLEQHGDEAEQSENVARRIRLNVKLQPVYELGMKQVEEARAIAGSAYIELEQILAMRGRVALPNFIDGPDADTAWNTLEMAHKLVTDGIASYERQLAEAHVMMNLNVVSKRELEVSSELARDLAPVADLAFGVKNALDNAERVMVQVRGEAPEISGWNGAVTFVLGERKYATPAPQPEQEQKTAPGVKSESREMTSQEMEERYMNKGRLHSGA